MKLRYLFVVGLSLCVFASCSDPKDVTIVRKGYYFVMTTVDEWGNESEPSNMVYSPRVMESVVVGGEAGLSSGSAVFGSGGVLSRSGAKPVPGVISVKFKEGMRAALSSSIMGRAAVGGGMAVRRSGIEQVDRAASQIDGGVSYQRVFKYIEKHEHKAIKHGLDLWYKVSFDGIKVPVEQAVSAFSQVDQIEVVEGVVSAFLGDDRVSDFISSGSDVATKQLDAQLPFNDPYLYRQWHYDNRVSIESVHPNGHVNLFRAWKKQTGNPSVIVAIIDSNMDINHEDLSDAIWVNSREIPGNGIDDDGNGYVDDVTGWDFRLKTGNLNHNGSSHGTHVGGTVGAINNNGKGLCGIAGGSGRGDGVRLMNCNILTGPQADYCEAEAIKYAADNGAVIAQCSWGFLDPNDNYKALEDAIDYFIAEAGNVTDFPSSPMRGGVVICATGNDGRSDEKYYPSAYPQVISVSATNIKGERPRYANVGYWVNIAAPGGADPVADANGPGVMSCVPGGYGSMSGTSMSAPHVSGIAALLVADNPGITATELREKIVTSGKNFDPNDVDYLEKMGGGCINSSKYLAINDKMAPVAVSDLDFRYSKGVFQFAWSVPVDHGEDEIKRARIYYHWEPITKDNMSQVKQYSFSTSSATGRTATLDVLRIPGIEVAPE